MKNTLAAHIKDGGNTANTKTGGWRTFKPEIHMEKCIDCGSCWIFCPDASVDKVNGEYKINLDFCKGCGVCANECPAEAITMVLEEK